ncbi:hypothetical protein Tco_0383572 [Tanacetum coccineum]
MALLEEEMLYANDVRDQGGERSAWIPGKYLSIFAVKKACAYWFCHNQLREDCWEFYLKLVMIKDILKMVDQPVSKPSEVQIVEAPLTLLLSSLDLPELESPSWVPFKRENKQISCFDNLCDLFYSAC